MIDVSIIVPVYNAEAYMERCIQSLLKQTLQNIEIILVDDGSTDRSCCLCDEYARRDERVLVIHQKNRGASSARNTGIRNAKGKYIGFVDADDFVESDMYKKMYEQAVVSKAEIVFCNLYTNNDKMKAYIRDGIYEGDKLTEEIYPRLISVIDEKRYGKVLRGAVWCRIFEREFLLKNDIFFNENLIYNEDGLFCIQSTLKCQRYLYLGQEYLYHHMQVEGSITKRYINNLWIMQKVMIDELKKCTKDYCYDFSEQIAKKTFDIAVYSIENEIKKNNKNSFRAKLKQIKDIVNDPLISEAIRRLEGKQMNKINSAYYKCIKNKKALLSFACAKYRYRNNKLF